MSFITNPLSRRVGISNYWQHIWNSFSWINYSLLLTSDRLILLYLEWFVQIFQGRKSNRYTKIVNKLCRNYKRIMKTKIFWLWPKWKILRFSDNISIICNFYVQYKTPDNLLFKKNPSKKKNIDLNILIKNFILIYKKFFTNCFVLKTSRYYNLKDKYFTLIKYFYIYNYWYYYIKNMLKISIIKYIAYYQNLRKTTLWFNFWTIQIKFFIKKLIKNNPIYIYYYIFPFEFVNSEWILSFLKVKLLQNFSIKSIIMNVFKHLNKLSRAFGFYIYKGLKICVAGRFTRKERKLFWWYSKGFLGQNQLTGWLEYSSSVIILTNSICGLKIWLRKNPSMPLAKTLTIEHYRDYYY